MEIVTRYEDGAMPCRATMCAECDGTGVDAPPDGVCADCGGSGRRRGLSPLRAALAETLASYAEPLAFAWFMWREYGWREGRPLPGLAMVWRDHARNRGALWRYLWARVTGGAVS